MMVAVSQGHVITFSRELRCQCVKVFSHGISTGSIASVDFIPEGPHCIRPEVILTRKDGKQFCLNTTMPWVQKVIQRFAKAVKCLLLRSSCLQLL
uniref:Chemokine interleukin-8-like domain-containing protein n=1 Tax=Naja naja TaxID=35670 RepID=A0A8C6VKZ0_NAJNA